MDETNFQELLAGIREAGAIHRGEAEPARVTAIYETGVTAQTPADIAPVSPSGFAE